MSKIIFFSGACNSGKSSALKLAELYLKDKGYQVKTLEESFIPVDASIDDLRKDANKYFEAQKEYILNRIAREKEIVVSQDNTIWLVNRALTDTLAYYLFYINKAELTEENVHEYTTLYLTLIDYLYTYANNPNNYWCVHLVNSYLDIDLSKKSRPKYLKDLQIIEDSLITYFNRMYFYFSGDTKNIIRVRRSNIDTELYSIIDYLKKYFLCDTQK